MPMRSCGRGGGLVFGSMLPIRSVPWVSSTRWPDGDSKRIASPQPGPSSRSANRLTGTPAASSFVVKWSRSEASLSLNDMWSRP